MSWRPAKSLIVLRDQVNKFAPERDKSSDGTIAGAQHHVANPKSDHEADRNGIVHALDITNDPRHGVNSRKLAEALLTSGDPRIKYLISNRQIAAPSIQKGKWRAYNGSSPHTEHMHLSIVADPKLADSEQPWNLAAYAQPTQPQQPQPLQPQPQPQPLPEPDKLRQEMAKQIVDWEARRDAKGHLQVYKLPANDGGGKYEVAGINERYNPKEAAQLKYLVSTGQYDEAESYAQNVILKDTDGATQWTQNPGVEFFLRDTIFNRGLKGAAKIMQHELGVPADGVVGPITRKAIAEAEKDPERRLKNLRAAREWYERNVVGYRANFWRGLTNRWNNALASAEKLEGTDWHEHVA